MRNLLHSTCLCGRFTEEVQPRTDLPVQSYICHCNSCRCNIGSLFYSSFPVVGTLKSVPNLNRYDCTQNISRFFCATCGTHICFHDRRTDSWYVSTGTVDHVTAGEQVFGQLETVYQHQHVEDTKDGGLASCLPAIASLRLPAVSGLQRLGGSDLQSNNALSCSWEVKDDRLSGSCHCGNVAFNVTRPNHASRKCSAPWPDLIRPYCSSDPENPSDEKWWICGKRYLAGTCACRTCRLAFGSPIVAWAFIPRANVHKLDDSEWDFNNAAMSTYESSPRKWRVFCSNCGASCFWHCEERPGVLDVSVGILHAEEGARAETWLEWWTERVSFSEEAFDRAMVQLFERGLRTFRTA